jgi:hypothetical protein
MPNPKSVNPYALQNNGEVDATAYTTTPPDIEIDETDDGSFFTHEGELVGGEHAARGSAEPTLAPWEMLIAAGRMPAYKVFSWAGLGDLLVNPFIGTKTAGTKKLVGKAIDPPMPGFKFKSRFYAPKGKEGTIIHSYDDAVTYYGGKTEADKWLKSIYDKKAEKELFDKGLLPLKDRLKGDWLHRMTKAEKLKYGKDGKFLEKGVTKWKDDQFRLARELEDVARNMQELLINPQTGKTFSRNADPEEVMRILGEEKYKRLFKDAQKKQILGIVDPDLKTKIASKNIDQNIDRLMLHLQQNVLKGNPMKQFPYNIETVTTSKAPYIDNMTFFLKHQKPSTLPTDKMGVPFGAKKVIKTGPWKNQTRGEVKNYTDQTLDSLKKLQNLEYNNIKYQEGSEVKYPSVSGHYVFDTDESRNIGLEGAPMGSSGTFNWDYKDARVLEGRQSYPVAVYADGIYQGILKPGDRLVTNPAFRVDEIPMGYQPPQSTMQYLASKAPKQKTDMTGKYNTGLSEDDQKLYNIFEQSFGVTEEDKKDYDVQGLFASGDYKDPSAWESDKFKKPNHPTFSVESIYNEIDGNQGGEYTSDGEFEPGSANMKYNRVDDLINHLSTSGMRLKLAPYSQKAANIEPDRNKQYSDNADRIGYLRTLRQSAQYGGDVYNKSDKELREIIINNRDIRTGLESDNRYENKMKSLGVKKYQFEGRVDQTQFNMPLQNLEIESDDPSFSGHDKTYIGPSTETGLSPEAWENMQQESRSEYLRTRPSEFQPGSENWKTLDVYEKVANLGNIIGTDLLHIPEFAFTLQLPKPEDYNENVDWDGRIKSALEAANYSMAGELFGAGMGWAAKKLTPGIAAAESKISSVFKPAAEQAEIAATSKVSKGWKESYVTNPTAPKSKQIMSTREVFPPNYDAKFAGNIIDKHTKYINSDEFFQAAMNSRYKHLFYDEQGLAKFADQNLVKNAKKILKEDIKAITNRVNDTKISYIDPSMRQEILGEATYGTYATAANTIKISGGKDWAEHLRHELNHSFGWESLGGTMPPMSLTPMKMSGKAISGSRLIGKNSLHSQFSRKYLNSSTTAKDLGYIPIGRYEGYPMLEVHPSLRGTYYESGVPTLNQKTIRIKGKDVLVPEGTTTQTYKEWMKDWKSQGGSEEMGNLYWEAEILGGSGIGKNLSAAQKSEVAITFPKQTNKDKWEYLMLPQEQRVRAMTSRDLIDKEFGNIKLGNYTKDHAKYLRDRLFKFKKDGIEMYRSGENRDLSDLYYNIKGKSGEKVLPSSDEWLQIMKKHLNKAYGVSVVAGGAAASD